MVSRRNSTKAASDDASPRLTSGSSGGRRLSGIVTDQHTFRASTAGTLQTESPKSETSPQSQAIPPLPPRPRALPPLPPGNNGLKRKSLRFDTNETYATAYEEHASTSPRAPIMPGFPHPQVPGHPHPTPAQQEPFPGGFAIRSRIDSRHNTGGYTYRFGTMPSPRSDSGPPQYEPGAVTGGIHAKVWPIYNKISKEFDDKKSDKWNKDLDVLLLFVSLVFGRDRWFRSN